ncbi:MAG TPA: ABC transporter ATP-binding protein [Promineifilum sp.]
MIRTENLTRAFGDYVAVDRLTLEIASGEVFGFLGPNGAGKTTTIRMLTGLIAPTSGSASVLEYEVGRDDDRIRRNVGILTETPGMYDRLSAHRNLAIFARLYEVENVDRQVEKYLKLLGLWERRNDAVGEFSKGMRQKLAICRALLHEPRVLFLDEPTSALDPEAARLIHDFIGELKGHGRTIFLCTHNLDEADRLCDRVAVFKSHLRVLDTPAKLRRQIYGRQIVVHLAGPAEPFLTLVRRMPEVKSADGEDHRLILSLDDPESQNPAIIRALVSAGADLQFVGEVRYSLEDVYLQLMKVDPQPAAPPISPEGS